MSSDALDRLGRAVLERRSRLGFTQGQVADAGGPSDRTVRALENGTAGTPWRTTLHALDEGLRWDHGTATRVYRGEQTVGSAVDARQVTTLGDLFAPALAPASTPAVEVHQPRRPAIATEVALLLADRPELTDADRHYLVELVAAFERWKRETS